MPTKLKKLLNPDNVPPLHKLINAWDIIDDTLIGVDGSFTNCYEVCFLPDAVHMAESEENAFLESFKRALLLLPDDYVLAFIVSGRWGNNDKIREYERSVRPASSVMAQEIVSRKVRQFGKINSRRMSYKLFVTRPPGQVNAVGADRFYFNKIFNPVGVLKENYERDNAKHSDACSNFIRALDGAGIKTRRMTKSDIIREFYVRLNPSYHKSVSFKPLDGETLRSRVCRSAAEHTFYGLTLDGHYYRGVNIVGRPESVNFFQIAKFFAKLEVAFDAVFTLRYTPDSLQSDSLVRKEMKFDATVAAATMTAEGRQKSDAIHQMLSDTLGDAQRIFDFSLCVIVEENNKEFLDKKTHAALGAFREISDATAIIDDMNHLYLFLSALPGHWFYNRRTHKFAIDAIAHFLPAHRPWQGSSSPKMLFPTAGGELIGLDTFDTALPAKHGLIIGSTGKGKSFTTNYVLTNFLVESPNNRVVIIDVGGSYRKLCEVFNGQYIDVRYDDACSFNPFPAKRYFFGADGKPDADSLSFLSLIIQKMLKRETFSGRETMIVETALIDTYRNSKSDPPSLGDFASGLKGFSGDEEDKATAVEFFKDLGPWVEGRYSILLNNPTPRLVLDPQKQLVVFDLQKIKDEPDLGPVMFFVVRSAIQSRLADLSCNKIIVIDEGWQFFSDAVGSELVSNLYRTARKFGGAVFSISQSPEDFLETPAATAIISNTYVKYILGLSARHELLSRLDLKPSEIEEVKALKMSPGKYSEVFYKFLGHCIVLKIQPNPLDYWICTTNDKDKNIEDAMRKKHPELSIGEIMLKLAGDNV